MDVRKMYSKEFVYAYDLEGKDVTVTIERVKAGKITGTDGKQTAKPVLFFKGSEKGLALNITNARTIAGLYGGFDSDLWIGKKITLYPTTTTFGRQSMDCIRIRNVIPKGKEQVIRNDVPQPDAESEPSAPVASGADLTFTNGPLTVVDAEATEI